MSVTCRAGGGWVASRRTHRTITDRFHASPSDYRQPRHASWGIGRFARWVHPFQRVRGCSFFGPKLPHKGHKSPTNGQNLAPSTLLCNPQIGVRVPTPAITIWLHDAASGIRGCVFLRQNCHKIHHIATAGLPTAFNIRIRFSTGAIEGFRIGRRVRFPRGGTTRMSKYRDYMASPEWQAKRAQVMKRAKGKCEICRHTKATQVHHLTYKNLGDEPLEDLQAVCISCHASQHPDKLDGRFIPVVEAGCEMCPNEMVEVFWEDRTCRTFCPQCGHSTTAHFPKRKRRHKNRLPEWRERERKAERAKKRRLKREERDREVRALFTPGKARGLYRCTRCDAQVNVKRRQSHFRKCHTRDGP